MPHYTEYENIRYDDPSLQAELQKLIEDVAVAERARVPVQDQHRQAESELDVGGITEEDFRKIDSQFISANNRIATAKKKIDEFLQRYKNFRVV